MGTVATPPPHSGPSSESLPHIDIRKLSQSELYALSTCSDFAFDLSRTDDVVSPNIDRANFNESAGSRRQTYSFHRDNHHHRRNRLLSAAIQPPDSDPEDRSILHFLKHYVKHNSTATAPPPPSPVTGDRRRQLALAVHVAEKKRKRTQKKGSFLPRNGVQLQKVNKEGKEVDFAALERNGDELYTDELGKWTAGLQTEDELLEFLSGLEGQWGSTRKRRKYVDASKFGGALPVGWKLLLGLKRRNGSVWVYCRRLLSPTGEQFLSCKEAASFLHSYFEAKGSKQPVDRQICLVEQASAMVSENGADFVAQDGSGLAPSFSLVPVEDGKGAYLADIDNLPEVHIRDLFECYSCKLAFDEKNAYLQHLMSVHQQTTRRFKFRGMVSEGFIGNGTYECQFCHKVFREKNKYNGHVAVHNVHSRKDTGTSEAKLVPDDIQELRESPSKEVLHPTEFSLNDRVADSSTGYDSAAFNISRHAIMISEDTSDKVRPNETCNKDPSLHGNDCILADGKTMDIDGQETLETNQNDICVPFTGLSDRKELKGEESFGCRSSEITTAAAKKVLPNDETMLPTENVLSPVSLAQPFDHLSPMSNKGGSNEFCTDSQKPRNSLGFEELELDEMEYCLVDGNRGLDSACNTQESIPSVGSDSKDAQIKMMVTKEFTTVCVWCRSEFQIEKAFEPEMQLDSIGYMCAKCKDNISGHFNRICS